MLDYIIVGGGLAGISLAESARRRGKSFVVITDNVNNSSIVAAGIYNPVILKRFKAVSGAVAQLEQMNVFYDELESRLSSRFRYPMPVLRKFQSIEEQNNWFSASDNPSLTDLIKSELSAASYNSIASPFGFGEVAGTGWVDTNTLIVTYQNYLTSQLLLVNEKFDYDRYSVAEGSYAGYRARHIVFAEGFGIRQNPWFSYLPLDGTKGEILTILSKDLKVDAILNTGVFILPIGNDKYRVGATYNWTDKSCNPTLAAREELVSKLDESILCDYEIIDHQAGIRPTVKDRKPLLGTHHEHRNIHILNGLGTRGVMLAPLMAETLLDSIEAHVPIPREISISRFDNLRRPSGHNGQRD